MLSFFNAESLLRNSAEKERTQSELHKRDPFFNARSSRFTAELHKGAKTAMPYAQSGRVDSDIAESQKKAMLVLHAFLVVSQTAK